MIIKIILTIVFLGCTGAGIFIPLKEEGIGPEIYVGTFMGAFIGMILDGVIWLIWTQI